MKLKLNNIILIIGCILIIIGSTLLYTKLENNTLFNDNKADLWLILMFCLGIFIVFKIISLKPKKIKKFNLHQDDEKEDS